MGLLYWGDVTFCDVEVPDEDKQADHGSSDVLWGQAAPDLEKLCTQNVFELFVLYSKPLIYRVTRFIGPQPSPSRADCREAQLIGGLL